MNKKRIRGFIEESMHKQLIMNTYFYFSYYYCNLIPVMMSNKLLLAINEDDFVFDGYRIVRLKDIEKIRIKDDICSDILRKEGLFDNFNIPKMNIDSWQETFTSLLNIGKNIIVEKESLDNTEYLMGKVVSIRKKKVVIRGFDADGIWNKTTTKIPYSEITTVRFGTRYVDIFSKYLNEV